MYTLLKPQYEKHDNIISKNTEFVIKFPCSFALWVEIILSWAIFFITFKLGIFFILTNIYIIISVIFIFKKRYHDFFHSRLIIWILVLIDSLLMSICLYIAYLAFQQDFIIN